MALHHLRDNITFVVGPASNWAVLSDGDMTSWILLDGGYPGDVERVAETATEVGAKGLPEAVILTHAHVDHIGAALDYARRGVPVWCAAAEVGNATGAMPSQIDPKTALSMAENSPLWASWVEHALSVGALSQDRFKRRQLIPFSPEHAGPLDLPASPVPILAPGHTPGHTAFLCDGVLFSGDSLITDHPTSPVNGTAQMLDPAFHGDLGQSMTTSRKLLAVEADTLAPGHGRPLPMAQAREHFSAPLR